MALQVDRIRSIQSEIESLEFRCQIISSSMEDCWSARSVAERVQNYRQRIAELRLSLSQLIPAQDSLLVLSETARCITRDLQTRCSVDNLSFEMLWAIFMWAPMDSEARTEFATSVSQVSRYWREVALKTPFIWSGIYVEWTKGYLTLLPILYQRSGSHPLDIEVYLPSWRPEYSTGTNSISAHIQALIPEVSRWRSFICETSDVTDVFKIVGPLVHLRAPILESFSLHETLYTDIFPDPQSNLFQGGAPMLSHVSIDGMGAMSYLPPLSSVTSLHISAALAVMTGRQFLDLLRLSPSVESLDLSGDFPVVDYEDLYLLALEGEHVEFASLRSFTFSANVFPKYCLESLLGTLRCPKLKKMTIFPWDGSDHHFLADTQALPVPIYPELQYLELQTIDCDPFVANFDFTQLPALETISLSYCTSPMSVLRLLLPSQGKVNNSECIWPMLRNVQLAGCDVTDFDGLREVISYRRTIGKPIEAVEINRLPSSQYFDELSG
jgi:hypothetical protein